MVEDNKLWNVICNGPHVLMKTAKVGEITIMVRNSRKKYEKDDQKKIEKRYNAKKLLVCGIGPDEYNRIFACKSAKEIWEFL